MRSLILTVVAAAALAGCATSSSHHAAAGSVAVSVTSCGTGWTNTKAGAQHITLHNTDSRGGEAQLINPSTGAVYADIEPLGPGTTADVDVSLSAGRYAWRCLMEDEAAVVGTPVKLVGTAKGTTPGVVPVSQADLISATQAYESYVKARLPQLRRDVTRLGADIANRAQAKRDWLVAHLEYERLGAAYDAFGDLDADINGLPNGLPGGVRDAHWTGFHRIEYGLWRTESTAKLRALTQQLGASVVELQHQFATAQIDPLQISIRAHEISENALQFELTGRTDYGSHSMLDTVHANLEGTDEVLAIIRSLLAPRYAKLADTETHLHAAEADIVHHASHERIDADISELCEMLAPVAAILEPRKTS